MENTLFLGRKGDVEPVQRRAWKTPFYIGLAIVIGFIAFEIFKLYYFAIATDVIYVDYGGETVVRMMGSMTAAVATMLVMGLLIAALVRASSKSITSSRFYWILIIICAIMLIVSLVITILRFVLDVRILKDSTFPWYDIWIYRFMDGTTILFEWDVIPDIIFNGALIFGIIMMIASLVDLFAEVGVHANVMETGLVSSGETFTRGKETFDLDCKIKNGIKACKIR